MDEIKRISLLCEAFKAQRDEALGWHANAMVELTHARDEIADLKAKLEAVPADGV